VLGAIAEPAVVEVEVEVEVEIEVEVGLFQESRRFRGLLPFFVLFHGFFEGFAMTASTIQSSFELRLIGCDSKNFC
jgi:hypothetical protein